MDREFAEILNKILQNQTSMSEDLSSLKVDVSSLKEDVSSLKVDVSSLKEDVGSLKVDVSSLRSDVNVLQPKVTDNSLMIENIGKDIKIIIEVQQNHLEQNQRQHKEMIKALESRADVVEVVVKRLSNDIHDIKEDNESLDKVLGKHDRAIETIKRRLVGTL